MTDQSAADSPERSARAKQVLIGIAAGAALLTAAGIGGALGNRGGDEPQPFAAPPSSTEQPTTTHETVTTSTTTTTTAPPTTVATTTTPPATNPPTTAAPPPPPPPVVTQPQPVVSEAYYANCDAVRAAGKAPLHRGQPGYRAGLDRDDDGIACET